MIIVSSYNIVFIYIILVAYNILCSESCLPDYVTPKIFKYQQYVHNKSALPFGELHL